MKETEIRDILQYIRSHGNRNLRWELLTGDYENNGYTKIYHIVNYDLHAFMDKLNDCASGKLDKYWTDLFYEDRQKCHDRLKLSCSIMQNSIQVSESLSGAMGQAITKLFSLFINQLNDLSIAQVESRMAQKSTEI